jgi:DNA-binding phage protein
LKRELAQVLRGLVVEKQQPAATVARELGYSKQRFYQLTSASHDASCEAIERVINQLGYQVVLVVAERNSTNNHEL